MTQLLPGYEALERHVQALKPIPVLTLWEPWASLIVAGFKRHETRHWSTKVRGRVAIHAAKKIDVEGAPTNLCDFALGAGWQKNRPRGCVVAVANLTGCYLADHLIEGRRPLLQPVEECDELAGNYSDGRFGFRLDDVRPLREPLPLISRQTPFWAWTPPADLADRLLPPVDHFAAAKRWLEHWR
jgi:hypothetical protein